MKSDAFTFAWEGKGYTAFDLERSVEESVNYGNIERAKNGYVVSTKYTGKKTYQSQSKVLVFAIRTRIHLIMFQTRDE